MTTSATYERACYSAFGLISSVRRISFLIVRLIIFSKLVVISFITWLITYNGYYFWLETRNTWIWIILNKQSSAWPWRLNSIKTQARPNRRRLDVMRRNSLFHLPLLLLVLGNTTCFWRCWQCFSHFSHPPPASISLWLGCNGVWRQGRSREFVVHRIFPSWGGSPLLCAEDKGQNSGKASDLMGVPVVPVFFFFFFLREQEMQYRGSSKTASYLLTLVSVWKMAWCKPASMFIHALLSQYVHGMREGWYSSELVGVFSFDR